MIDLFKECRDVLKIENQIKRILENESVHRVEIAVIRERIKGFAELDQFDELNKEAKTLKRANLKLDKLLDKQSNMGSNLADRLASLNHIAKEIIEDPQTWIDEVQEKLLTEALEKTANNETEEVKDGKGEEIEEEEEELLTQSVA